jgi:hypothetical protein
VWVKQSIRLFLSAIVGFLIAAFLVLFPGSRFMHPGIREGQPQQIFQIYYHDLLQGMKLKNEEDRKFADDLRDRTMWLCLAQNEIDCLPLLLFAGCIGPAIILFRKRKSNQNQTSMSPKKIEELKQHPLALDARIEHGSIHSNLVSQKEPNPHD